jgi:hypothetical protein
MGRVPLRDHVESMASAESKRVNTLFGLAVLSAAFVWIELMRRLEALNHAHQTERERQADFVSEEIYLQDKAHAAKEVKVLTDEQTTSRARSATLLLVCTVGPAILGIIVLFANGKI